MLNGEGSRTRKRALEAGGDGPTLAAAPAGAAPLTAELSGWARTFSSLRSEPYRWFWSGQLAYFLGIQMDTFTRGYLAFELTGAATALGLVWVAWGLPMFLLSLVAGAVADRVDKRNLLLSVQVAMSLLALILAILVHSGVVALWHLIALGVGLGVVWAFTFPTRMALLPILVEEDDLTNALALNNAAMNGTRILGPSLAGGLIAVPLLGVSGVFYVVMLFHLVVALTLLQIPKTGRPSRARAPLWEEMGAGIRYTAGRRSLVILMVMGFVPILVGMSYAVLLPVFAKEVHDVGSVGLGIMGAAVGLGAVVGSLVIAYFSRYPHQTALQVALGIGFGVALFAFAESPAYLLALAALIFVGLTFSSYLTLNNSLIFSLVDQEYYGRVMSVYMLSWSLMPITTLPLTGLADAIGAQATVAIAGASIALFITGVALFYPDYWRVKAGEGRPGLRARG